MNKNDEEGNVEDGDDIIALSLSICIGISISI
jgi:hypothetical protein